MQAIIAIEKWRQELTARMSAMARTYGWERRERLSVAALIKILSSCVCDRRIKYFLENPFSSTKEGRFDSYYREKNDFATITILDHIKAALSVNGIKAVIQTERRSDIGRYDIVITHGSPSKVCAYSEELRVEVKASLGFSLEQIARYLWHPSTVILVRVITRQVAKLEPSTLQRFIIFSLKGLIAKADRILSGELYTIPGTDCIACPDSECSHNHSLARTSTPLITMPDDEFEDDLELFFRNLSYVSVKAARLVVGRFKNTPSRDQAMHAIPAQSTVGRDPHDQHHN